MHALSLGPVGVALSVGVLRWCDGFQVRWVYAVGPSGAQFRDVVELKARLDRAVDVLVVDAVGCALTVARAAYVAAVAVGRLASQPPPATVLVHPDEAHETG